MSGDKINTPYWRRNEAWARCGWLPVPGGYYRININKSHEDSKAPY